VKEKIIEYTIPWGIMFREYNFWEKITWLSLAVCASLLVILNLNVFLNPNIYTPEGRSKPLPLYGLQYFLPLFALIFSIAIIFGMMHSLGKSHAVCDWILDNVTCPACGGKIKSCPYKGWTLYTEYDVQCSKCNKTSAFGTIGWNKITLAWKVPTLGDLTSKLKPR
jgi:hypothetical protein